MKAQAVELGHLAHPAAAAAASPGAHPGVVLIPDVRGLSDHYRALAERLAAEGFVTLAIDLYRRGAPPEFADPQAALGWIAQLSDPQVLADVQAGIDLLAAHPAVDGRRVGVTGFCMGGQYALLAAGRCKGVSACVAFYGMLRYAEGLDAAKKPCAPLDALEDLRCPLLGLYGEQDALIPVPHVEALRARLAASGQPGEVRLYPRAGHAFMNDTRPDSYRPEAARDAWARMLAFFRAHIGPVPGAE